APSERPPRRPVHELARADRKRRGRRGRQLDGRAGGAPARQAGADAGPAVLRRLRDHGRPRLVRRDPRARTGAAALPARAGAHARVPARGDARLPARRAGARRPLAGECPRAGRVAARGRAPARRLPATLAEARGRLSTVLFWDIDGTLLTTGRAGLFA